ncbi:MAG: hypothetical protein U0T69_11335 [Chitinophagales bacterium]
MKKLFVLFAMVASFVAPKFFVEEENKVSEDTEQKEEVKEEVEEETASATEELAEEKKEVVEEKTVAAAEEKATQVESHWVYGKA